MSSGGKRTGASGVRRWVAMSDAADAFIVTPVGGEASPEAPILGRTGLVQSSRSDSIHGMKHAEIGLFRMMLFGLRGEKLPNRSQGCGILRSDPHLAPARQICVCVGDDAFLARHRLGTGHRPHVDESRSSEVSRLERVLNQPEVRADLRYRD